jgi:hypothetical protein
MLSRFCLDFFITMNEGDKKFWKDKPSIQTKIRLAQVKRQLWGVLATLVVASIACWPEDGGSDNLKSTVPPPTCFSKCDEVVEEELKPIRGKIVNTDPGTIVVLSTGITVFNDDGSCVVYGTTKVGTPIVNYHGSAGTTKTPRLIGISEDCSGTLSSDKSWPGGTLQEK